MSLRDLLKPLQGRQVLLHTRLSVGECQQRLMERTEHVVPHVSLNESGQTPVGKRPVRGWVTPWSFALQRNYGFGRFVPRANGQFKATPSGTDIRVTLGIPRWVIAVWVLSSAPVFAMMAVVAPWAIPLAALWLFGVGIVLSNYVARGDDAFLEQFLRETLEAEEVAPSSSPQLK